MNVVWFHVSVFSFPSATGHCLFRGRRGGEQQRGRALARIACVVLHMQVKPGRIGSCGSVNVAQYLHLGSVGNFSVVRSCLADHDHFYVILEVSSGFFCSNWIIRKLCSVGIVL